MLFHKDFASVLDVDARLETLAVFLSLWSDALSGEVIPAMLLSFVEVGVGVCSADSHWVTIGVEVAHDVEVRPFAAFKGNLRAFI